MTREITVALVQFVPTMGETETNLRHGVEEQQALLEAEGVEFDARGYIDWKRFGWEGISPVELEALLADS